MSTDKRNIHKYLMLVDANCDDGVTIPRCPNLVVDLKVSVTLKNNFCALTRAFWAPPYFKSWIHPCSPKNSTPLELLKSHKSCTEETLILAYSYYSTPTHSYYSPTHSYYSPTHSYYSPTPIAIIAPPP